MLDPITALILKVVASACIKFYLASLMGVGQVSYKSADLGYKIPKWYMNPGRVSRTFYSYGTSVSGDEFESIEDARHKAVDQMAQHIRLGNRALIEKEVRYDVNSVKQKRLIELFIRGEGLEQFIRMNAKMDKKQLVKVKVPKVDMRAFVRLDMKSKTYIAYQGKTLHELKTRLVQQKTDDILDEMQAELAAWEKEAAALPGGAIPASIKPGDLAPPAMPDSPPSAPPKGTGAPSGGPFGDMERELNDAE
ncbi:MAG: hypothetical protein HN919_17870 [Verrucomicrobia bacterium]|jgi:hypothetical protein|nr:hypothetical protein [Verrucomicrobiota bacterium]MBT7068168.1 hypothetical protein [Verrucomicrobiota bacterium]MBT7700424.1 hypothetical protein [Verrucomicrobiota bacterium]